MPTLALSYLLGASGKASVGSRGHVVGADGHMIPPLLERMV
jgi:hypothetical protein